MTSRFSSRTGACTLSTALLVTTAPIAALAQPTVVADIAPVAALSDSLLGEAGATVLLIGPGTSPHSAALRPSQARGLQDADLVVGIGPALAPGLWDQIETLAEGVKHLELIEVDGLRTLPFPEAGVQDDHGHEEHEDHEDHSDEEHGHEDHKEHEDHASAEDDHGHDEHASAEEEHGHEEDAEAGHDDHGHEDHDHDHAHVGNTDPHLWLDPENAATWIDTLTAEFAQIDPANAALYAERATASKAAIAAAAEEVAAMMALYQGVSIITAHDDMRYFSTRFGLNTAGAVIPADGASPGAASVVALSERMAEGDIGCLLTDPSHPSRLAEQLAADAGISTVGLAPLGVPGQTYPEMLTALGAGLAACLAETG